MVDGSHWLIVNISRTDGNNESWPQLCFDLPRLQQQLHCQVSDEGRRIFIAIGSFFFFIPPLSNPNWPHHSLLSFGGCTMHKGYIHISFFLHCASARAMV